MEYSRHTIIISNPVVRNGCMFLSLFIHDWNKDLCFYYPLNLIDNKKLLFHVMWKLSGDSGLKIHATADLIISAREGSDLCLKNWSFA